MTKLYDAVGRIAINKVDSVAANFQSPEEIARFGELIASLPKPILAFCRSGTRSGRLWRAATGR